MNDFTGFITNDDTLFNGQFAEELQNLQLSIPQTTIANQQQISNLSYCDIQNVNYSNIEENLVPCNTVSTNIPFVTIHAFENSNVNLVNNSNRNQNDIKPEPIKSELSEAQCNSQTTQPTQTPPSSCIITSDFATEITNALTTISSIEENDTIYTEEINKISKPSPPTLLKCTKCLFLCISQTNLDIHIASLHNENENEILQNKIFCPGCDNIFISKNSFKYHLEYDHSMLSDDLTKFLESVPDETSKKKSRIYLKNVEYLREKPPLLDNIEIQNLLPHIEESLNDMSLTNASDKLCDYDLIDLINDDNEILPIPDEYSTNKKKQKITIKSVETLREPVYEHDFYTSNITVNSESFEDQNAPVYYNMDTGYPTTQSSETNNIRSNNELLLDNHLNSFQKDINKNECTEKQNRPPKIYIKNVDILKEPVCLPTASILQEVNETMSFNNLLIIPLESNVQEIPEALPIAPITVQSNLTISNSNSCHNSRNESYNNINNTPLPSLLPNINSTKLPSLFPNTNCVSYLNAEKNIGNQVKSKIYIKNDDILKQPQYQDNNGKKLTNCIHLRTVDELNLLNKTELNIMNDLNSNCVDKQQIENVVNSLSENSKNSDLDNSNNTFDIINSTCNENFDFQVTSIPLSTNWESHDYNNGGFESLDNLIDLNSNTTTNTERRNHQSQQYYDLNTPKRCELPLDEDIVIPTNDKNNLKKNENNLFMCSEMLFPYKDVSNSSFNPEQISIDLDSNLMIDVDLNDNSDNITELNKTDNYININPTYKFNLFETHINNKTENLIVSQIENNNEQQNQFQEFAKPNEKGRIYVSGNLMADITVNNENHDSRVKKQMGRRVGAKNVRRDNFDLNNINQNVFYKCDIGECGFRFKEGKNLEYHKSCHINDKNQMICPDCKSTEFTSWNTLHTHLWRLHNIDMELHSCDKCNFKTPILSRLLNTHNKIHSNERNFKCTLCEKAFKNSRQLKNHRRVHRRETKDEDIKFYNCDECKAIFTSKKSLNQHTCLNSKNIVDNAKCLICGKICSSKSYLKVHLEIHNTNPKFVCDCGEFSTNNASSFKKHKARHLNDNEKTYQCQYCDYKSIQASIYKKHLIEKHPENADKIIYQCKFCKFSSMRKLQYFVHMAKNHNVDITELQKKNNQNTVDNSNFQSTDVSKTVTLNNVGNKNNLSENLGNIININLENSGTINKEII